jgi:LysM domain
MFAKLIGLALLAVVVAAVVTRQSAGGRHEQWYVVRPYDTLWSIATTHYPGDPRDAVWKLERRNHLSDAVIRPGMRIVLPP